MAATKQCLRAHGMPVHAPLALDDFLPEVRAAPVALLAMAGAPPVRQVLEDAAQLLRDSPRWDLRGGHSHLLINL